MLCRAALAASRAWGAPFLWSRGLVQAPTMAAPARVSAAFGSASPHLARPPPAASGSRVALLGGRRCPKALPQGSRLSLPRSSVGAERHLLAFAASSSAHSRWGGSPLPLEQQQARAPAVVARLPRSTVLRLLASAALSSGSSGAGAEPAPEEEPIVSVEAVAEEAKATEEGEQLPAPAAAEGEGDAGKREEPPYEPPEGWSPPPTRVTAPGRVVASECGPLGRVHCTRPQRLSSSCSSLRRISRPALYVFFSLPFSQTRRSAENPPSEQWATSTATWPSSKRRSAARA